MGATEIAFIFLIYLLLFGAKGIPSMARTMGSTVRQFRQATDEIQREILSGTDGIRNEVNKVRDAADSMSKKPQKATNVQEDAGSTAGPIPPKDTPDTA
jgi:sec-independent protein translocase protein TatA